MRYLHCGLHTDVALRFCDETNSMCRWIYSATVWLLSSSCNGGVWTNGYSANNAIVTTGCNMTFLLSWLGLLNDFNHGTLLPVSLGQWSRQPQWSEKVLLPLILSLWLDWIGYHVKCQKPYCSPVLTTWPFIQHLSVSNNSLLEQPCKPCSQHHLNGQHIVKQILY